MAPVSVLLECQAPYTSWILSGRKTIETRRYPFPSHLLRKPIWLLESPSGVVGSSSLPSVVDLAATPQVRVVGRIVVSGSFQYTSRSQWDADADSHCVPPDSGYAWTESGGDYFGWTVALATELSHAPSNLTHISRSYRSFFVPVIPVPTVDISDPLNPNVLAAIEAQCASLGFLRVSWSSFPKDVVSNAHDAMRRFFDCDNDVKEAVSLPSSSGSPDAPQSYKPTGYRGLPKMHNGEGRETWSCTRPDFEPGHPDFADPFYTVSGRHVFATPPIPQVLWPNEEHVPGFRAALTAYYAAMDALGKVLFRMFARILQLPDEDALVNLARRHASSMNASRLHPSEDRQGGGVVLMPHADITCFTILSHDAEGAGTACLEVLHPRAKRHASDGDGDDVVWVGIAPNSTNEAGGSLLVNVGQILERWSNGHLKATLHRVVKPVHPSTLATQRRQALVFFQVADYDSVLTPMVRSDEESRWKPERMDAFTATRFGPIANKTLDTVDAYAIYNQDVMARDEFVHLARES